MAVQRNELVPMVVLLRAVEFVEVSIGRSLESAVGTPLQERLMQTPGVNLGIAVPVV
jgi:hypothetical protein